MSREPDLDGVMVFDGICNLCSGSVALVLRMDRKGVIRFVPLQSPFGQVIAARHRLDVKNPTSFIFFDAGRALQSSDAMIALAKRLETPWRLLSAFRLAPRPMRDALYGMVARNRYRLFGKRRACMVPAPEARSRFILEPPADWV